MVFLRMPIIIIFILLNYYITSYLLIEIKIVRVLQMLLLICTFKFLILLKRKVNILVDSSIRLHLVDQISFGFLTFDVCQHFSLKFKFWFLLRGVQICARFIKKGRKFATFLHYRFVVGGPVGNCALLLWIFRIPRSILRLYRGLTKIDVWFANSPFKL